MNTPVVQKVLDAKHVEDAVERLAQGILSNMRGNLAQMALVGIQRRGVILAQRLQERIRTLTKSDVSFGALDITLYRDDLDTADAQPMVSETHLDFDINDKVIFLIDDVLFTGRTVRAALDELIDFGRPTRIYLAVLVDRGHRELPIAPDFVGENIPTNRRESVEIHFSELDGKDEIVVLKENLP